MIATAARLLLVLPLLLAPACKEGKAAESGLHHDVHAAFESYRRAALARDGEAAAATLSADTHAMYMRLVQDGLEAPRAKIESMDAADQISVLLLRAKASREQLEAMQTGSAAIAFAVKEGVLGTDSVATIRLGDVELDGEDTAKAEILAGQRPSGLHFEFHREGDAWRFDLDSPMRIAGKAMAELARKKNMKLSDLVEASVRMASGVADYDALFEPLRR